MVEAAAAQHWCMETAQLSGVETLHCPRCARAGDLYDMLEQRVHEQQQMDRADYFEDAGNL